MENARSGIRDTESLKHGPWYNGTMAPLTSWQAGADAKVAQYRSEQFAGVPLWSRGGPHLV